ncbi:ComEC family competence protein [Patescibacteria group bacterium]|nr:MAG: ComEC family competence protein [Patescibacteria group bacterium]
MEKGIALLGRNIFLLASGTFLFGVFISSFSNFSFSTAIFFVFLSALLFLYRWLKVAEAETQRIFKIIALTLLFFAVGVARYEVKDLSAPHPALLERVGERASVTGVVVEEPEHRETYELYIIRASEFDGEKILVRAELYPQFDYGDEVKFSGRLDRPGAIEEGGRIFDYAAYLAKDDIYLILSFASGELVAEGGGSPVKRALLTVKFRFIGNFERRITEPASSLLSGIILGTESSLGKDLEQTFRTTGIIHIVVLSGYNITLVASSILWLLSRLCFLSRRVSLAASALGIVLFAIMVGGAPSVVRASLMAILVLLARATGRTYHVARGLVIAACAMVLWNPKVLVFDTGFELSFLATVALIWIAPLLGEKFSRITEKFALRTIVSDTVATQLFVLPLLLYKTGLFSVVSLPVNLLVLPIVPVIMFFGFFAGLLGFLAGFLAFPFAIIAQFLLTYVLKVVEWFSSLPFAAVSLTFFPAALMWFIFALYGFMLWRIYKNKRARQAQVLLS